MDVEPQHYIYIRGKHTAGRLPAQVAEMKFRANPRQTSPSFLHVWICGLGVAKRLHRKSIKAYPEGALTETVSPPQGRTLLQN